MRWSLFGTKCALCGTRTRDAVTAPSSRTREVKTLVCGTCAGKLQAEAEETELAQKRLEAASKTSKAVVTMEPPPGTDATRKLPQESHVRPPVPTCRVAESSLAMRQQAIDQAESRGDVMSARRWREEQLRAQARAAIGCADLEGADAALEKASTIGFERAETYLLQAQLRIIQERSIEEARTSLDLAVASDWVSGVRGARILATYGKTPDEHRLGRDAVQQFRQGIITLADARWEKVAKELRGEQLREKATWALRDGDLVEAERAVGQALATDEKDWQAHLLRADLLLTQGKDVGQVQECLDEAETIRAEAAAVRPKAVEASLRIRQEAIDQAESQGALALAREMRDEQFQAQIRWALEQGDTKSAEKFVTQALAANPRDREVYLLQARLRIAQGKSMGEVRVPLEQALSLDDRPSMKHSVARIMEEYESAANATQYSDEVSERETGAVDQAVASAKRPSSMAQSSQEKQTVEEVSPLDVSGTLQGKSTEHVVSGKADAACGRCANQTCQRCGLQKEKVYRCPELRFQTLLSPEAESAAEKIAQILDGGNMGFANLYDYAAREANTGNHIVAAELFHRIYQYLCAPGGDEETMLLSAFACSYCACRANGVWPIAPESFPAELLPRYPEARSRFVAALILNHGERKGIVRWAGGDSSGFQIRIGGSVHSLTVQNSGNVVVSPTTANGEVTALIEEAVRFQLTIPCLFSHRQLIAGTPWW